jgi:hypothetical protein
MARAKRESACLCVRQRGAPGVREDLAPQGYIKMMGTEWRFAVPNSCAEASVSGCQPARGSATRPGSYQGIDQYLRPIFPFLPFMA